MEFKGVFHADQPTDYFGADMETVWLTVTGKNFEVNVLVSDESKRSGNKSKFVQPANAVILFFDNSIYEI